MKRFFCVAVAVLLFSMLILPVSAQEGGCYHEQYPNSCPVGASIHYEPASATMHNSWYSCDGCGEKIVFEQSEHAFSPNDQKCDFCGMKEGTFVDDTEANPDEGTPPEGEIEPCKHINTSTKYAKIDNKTHAKILSCVDCSECISSEEEDHELLQWMVCILCLEKVEDQPVEVPPVEDDPVGDTPVEDPSIEDPPAEDKPVEDPTVDDPPVEDPPETEPPTEDDIPAEDDEETYIVSQLFEEKILPFLISAGSAFVMFIGAIVPAIKSSGKFKRLQGIYSATKAENAKYAELLQGTDLDKFKDTIENILTGDLKKKIAELGNFQPQFDEIYAKLELLFAQMQSMKEGALNAWAQSPAAVAALTASPTESAVLKLVQQNKALEGYIKDQKGEEAEKIIAELKGESTNDEQGNVPAV